MLEKTAVEVEAMMVRITADKKEAATTQKAVSQQEQEANEQAAQVYPTACIDSFIHLFVHSCHHLQPSAHLLCVHTDSEKEADQVLSLHSDCTCLVILHKAPPACAASAALFCALLLLIAAVLCTCRFRLCCCKLACFSCTVPQTLC